MSIEKSNYFLWRVGVTPLKAKINVIPNRALRPVRASPELAEGNLFSHQFHHSRLPLGKIKT